MSVGFLSDAHGNVEAFELGHRVLRRFGADTIYFLGDAVGYLPGPSVVEAVLAEGIPSIRGNHEAMLLAAGSTIPHDDVYQLRSTAAAMAPALLESVARWPVSRELWLGSTRAVLIHGSPDDPTFGYLYPDSDLDRVAARPELSDATVFMGNTHRPFVRRRGSTTFVNVGSCGLPRDVGTLGACCVFDEQTGTARILRYDIRDAVARARRRCGPFHEMVDEVLARRAPSHVGEVVDV
jgi:predicted phosphodiesterase